jgi:two-component system OmpR family response regulator
MKTQKTNIFIVDDDELMVMDLKISLENEFGNGVKVTTFNDGESCLEKVDEDLHIVILDYYMQDKNGMEVLKSIKLINPKTEIIMFTSNDDMITAIESLRVGAKEFVIKGAGSLGKVSKLVNYLIKRRLNVIARELSLSKYMTILLIALTIVCILVVYIMKTRK